MSLYAPVVNLSTFLGDPVEAGGRTNFHLAQPCNVPLVELRVSASFSSTRSLFTSLCDTTRPKKMTLGSGALVLYRKVHADTELLFCAPYFSCSRSQTCVLPRVFALLQHRHCRTYNMRPSKKSPTSTKEEMTTMLGSLPAIESLARPGTQNVRPSWPSSGRQKQTIPNSSPPRNTPSRAQNPLTSHVSCCLARHTS